MILQSKRIIAFCTWFFVLQIPLLSQQFTISGQLKDASSGEDLLYANVLVKETGGGATSNEYGFYSLSLPAGKYTLEYSYLGYQTLVFEVNLNQNIRKDVELDVEGVAMETVVVTAKEEDETLKNTEVGVVSLDLKQIKTLPVLMGEQDIVKSMQLMPGVGSSGEGGNGFFVRGGNIDQNLILLDEAPVFNASHLLGFFSVFNGDALKDVKLYKGGIPAEFGGRASSVMDIRMKDGNKKKVQVSGGLGLIASRLTVEGPLQKDRSSFIISGRRTYLDLIGKAFKESLDNSKLYFYDLTAKTNFTINENNRLFLSGYFGRDDLGIEDFGFDWGNKTGTLRWSHIFSEKLFSNTSLIVSDYDYSFKVKTNNEQVSLVSGINTRALKQDFDWYVSPTVKLRFGFSMSYNVFRPGNFSETTVSSNTGENISDAVTLQQQQTLENAVYLANEHQISPKLTVDYGLRVSSFHNIGAYNQKVYDEQGEQVNTIAHQKGDFFNSYYGFEPRFSANYRLNNRQSVKLAYNRTYQYLHLISNSTSGAPTDYWLPSHPDIKPQIANQVSAAFIQSLQDNDYQLSVESYYKTYQNLIDFEDGAETLLNEDLIADLTSGKGRAYGIEFLAKKNKGNFTGWVSYTLSRSQRQFAIINDGRWFSSRQDRTHDISLVGTYKLNKKLTLSGSWVYYTGDAVTLPTGSYFVNDQVVNLYSERNGSRMPNYHRLDIGLTLDLKDTDKYHSDLNFSIYNVYNRRNAYTINFRESRTNPGNSEAVRTALFGIIPSVTWNFKLK